MTTYDDSNIFARILRGEIPCHKVYEDAHTLAFMDVMPEADGHVLVIPKMASRNLLDAQPEVLSALMPVIQKIARAAKAAFAADGILVKQLNEVGAGQTIYHLHFHVIPRMEGVELRRHTGLMADNALLAAQAEKLRKMIG